MKSIIKYAYAYYKNHDYCYVEMPNEDNKISKYNPVEKSMKVLFIIYADLVCLLEKMNSCNNNPEKSSTTKIIIIIIMIITINI